MTVTVVGIGYGADTTAAVADVLGRADVVIGHEFFLRSVRGLVRPDAERFDVQDLATPEEDVFAVRTRVAAERSEAGQEVVVVSGGDPGLLGMAGPMFHNLARTGRADQVERMRVLPGLSAWQYASTELGAPFNAGVAVLSLCLHSHTDDLVARQVEGVARSGLGVVAYMLRHNGERHPELYPTPEPAADLARRRFTRLRDALLDHRPADTPTYLFTGLGSPDGHVCVTAPLADCAKLWEESGEESVFCVPDSDFEQAGDRLWART